MRSFAILFALVLCILCQGCVAFPYPTPEVRGSIIDADTKMPIAATRIAVQNHFSIHCTSASNGSFDLPAGSAWRPCFLLPGDVFFIDADVSFKAQGYQSVTKHFVAGQMLVPHPDGNDLVFAPVVLEQPIELKKEAQP